MESIVRSYLFRNLLAAVGVLGGKVRQHGDRCSNANISPPGEKVVNRGGRMPLMTTTTPMHTDKPRMYHLGGCAAVRMASWSASTAASACEACCGLTSMLLSMMESVLLPRWKHNPWLASAGADPHADSRTTQVSNIIQIPAIFLCPAYVVSPRTEFLMSQLRPRKPCFPESRLHC